MIGKIVSHYRILEKLGEGGMGVVYRAEDTKLGRQVAMKFLPPHVGTDEEKKQRFIQEAKTASLIDNPNIGTIYEINETEDGYLYIVMACYDGKTLKHKIEEGPLSVDESIDIALQIAMGMVKAHERGIIHRDLKPGNILITNDNVAKIIDFGLAKLSGGLQLTKSNTSIGTVAYMSPEQARTEEVDVRSDIWSLGIMLFEMLTSKLPFRGEFETAMMYSITNENPLPIETFRSSIPFDLKLIIAKALQKERTDRYQNMNELVTDLKALRKIAETDSAKVSDWRSASRAVSYALNRDRKKIILLSIPIVLAVLFLVIYYFSKTKRTSISTSKYIAVLPVANIGNPEQSYYANGFTEEISNELSSLPNVTVFGRTSVSAVIENGNTNDSLIIARLGARYLLKGDIQLIASRIKYNVRLIDGETGNELWSNQYDISRGDIFNVKEEVIRSVADKLGISSGLITKSKYRTVPDVYESYLQGIYYRDKNTKDDNVLAITFFTEAIRKDSSYVPALVALANAQVEHYRQGWDYSDKQLTNAEMLCKMALRLDSSSTSALAEYGIIADLRGNTDEGLRLLLQAYDNDKNKNNPIAISAIAYIYLFKLGDAAKGLMYSKRFHEIDPLNFLASLDLGVAYAQLKNHSEAINSFRIAYQLNPTHGWAPYSLGYAYERINQFDSSIYYYKIALKNDPTYPQTYESLNSVYLATNKFSAAESIMTSGFNLLPDDPQIIYSLGVAYLLGKKQRNAANTFELGRKLLDAKINKDPQISDYHAWHGLFLARLGDSRAILSFAQAVKLDSTNEEIIMRVTRGYAILGMRTEMIHWFKRVKAMNPEYDASYLRTALDFEKFRNDTDLLILARQ